MYALVHPFAPLAAQTTFSMEATSVTRSVQVIAWFVQLQQSVPHAVQASWWMALIYVHLVPATVMHVQVHQSVPLAAPTTTLMEEIYVTLPVPATASSAPFQLPVQRV